MIPLRADAATRRFPWMTLLVVAANAGVFAWMLRASGSWMILQGPAVDAILAGFSFVPARFTADPVSLAVWQSVFTSMFVHGGWLHIVFNMLYLWIFGAAIEDRLGPLWFLAFYLVCGVAAALTQWAVAPGSQVGLIGASGAIAGLLGAYLVLLPRTDITVVIPLFVFFEVATVPAWIVVGLFLVLQLAAALLSLAQPGGAGIAFFAHVGGFVAGAVLALPIALVSGARRRFDGQGRA